MTQKRNKKLEPAHGDQDWPKSLQPRGYKWPFMSYVYSFSFIKQYKFGGCLIENLEKSEGEKREREPQGLLGILRSHKRVDLD